MVAKATMTVEGAMFSAAYFYGKGSNLIDVTGSQGPSGPRVRVEQLVGKRGQFRF